MKKRILAVALPLFLGGVSQASPIELFEQDYKTITETVLDSYELPIFKDREFLIEGVTRSDNIADFEVNSQINFNGKENLQIQEVGEVVFTNYAENKGVATIISNSDYTLRSNIEGSDSVLMAINGVATQSQIDRENQHFKFSNQFPVIEITNPDTTKPGRIAIEGLVGEGNYGFKDNFEKINTSKGHYKTDKIVVEVEDEERNVKISINDLLLDTELNYAAKIQKSIFELNHIDVVSTDHFDQSTTNIRLGQFAYHTGVEIREDAPTIFAAAGAKEIQVTPKNSDLIAKLGDFSFEMLLTPLATDIFEKLQAAEIYNLGDFDASYGDLLALLKEYVVDETAIQFRLDGKLEGHEAKKFLSITPKSELIEKLASIDINDDAAVDQLFSGLTFFEFVNQYIHAIELDVTVSKAYMIEFGSNLLVALGEEKSIAAARKIMEENYQQMQMMVLVLSANAPLVTFDAQGARAHIEYKAGEWFVNGQAFDLEQLANLLN